MIDEPGVYNLSSEEYHADPCPTPSVSAGLLRTILHRSPLHAWMQHPMLGGQRREPSNRMAIGSAAHSLLLEGSERGIVEVAADDWRSKAAREERDAANAAGKIPLLSSVAKQVREMVAAALDQLVEYGPMLDGDPELSVLWREGDLWCRARPDLLYGFDGEHATLTEYKTTATGARPDFAERLIWRMGYDVQLAWYLRGLKAVTGREIIAHRIIVQEVEPPYSLSVLTLGPEALAVARARMESALSLWLDATGNGSRRPRAAYQPEIVEVSAPAYLAGRELVNFDGIEIETEA